MILKEKLGEELYEQVQEKLGDEKVAIVSDGSYIPKEKFDDKNQEAKDYKKQLKERDDQLEDLKEKAKDSKELQDEIDNLKQQNEDAKNDYEKQLTDTRKRSKLELAIKDAKAHDPSDVIDKLDLETIKLDDDKLLGFEEQLNNIKESKPYLFVSEADEKKLGGRDPIPPSDKGGKSEPNPFSKEHLNLTEQGRLLKEDPELAKTLKAKAK